jgi:hypothetical protein
VAQGQWWRLLTIYLHADPKYLSVRTHATLPPALLAQRLLRWQRMRVVHVADSRPFVQDAQACVLASQRASARHLCHATPCVRC